MTWWLWLAFGSVLFAGFMAFTGAPYLPSKRRDIQLAFKDLYKLTSQDTLVDIGSGDGIVLRQARQFGARVVGYEINPLLVIISRWLSRGDKMVTIRCANFWRQQLPDLTTVVYTFGDIRDIEKMFDYVEKEARRIGHDIAFISYGFDVKSRPVVRQSGAYFLYTASSLQDQPTNL